MEVDDLTDEQSDALSRFREFTHIDSVTECRQYLDAHEWNVERAIETALLSDSDPSSKVHDDPRLTTDALPSALSTPESAPDESTTQTTNHHTLNSLLRLLRFLLSFLYASYLKIVPYLPWTIIHIFVSFVQSFTWSGTPIDPIREIDDYIAYFDNRYGTEHPVFYRGRLPQALQDARREIRLLFIYLHDKDLPLCDRFCREVLCEDALRSIVGNNLLWSASRDTQEGTLASRMLRANSFPCFSIVAHRGSQQIVQLKLERYTDADEVLAEIMNGVQHAEQVLEYNRELRNSRNSRDRLLEEQNAAYLDSVRADEEKARQRLHEENKRRKVEEEQRRLEEERQRKLQNFTEFRHRIKQTFPDEPSSTETDTIQVSIRLPTTEPIRRRFHLSDSAKLLFEFAWTNSNVPNQFELLWGYPRQRYRYDQIGDQQIRDVMNGSTETCYLEQVDEENYF